MTRIYNARFSFPSLIIRRGRRQQEIDQGTKMRLFHRLDIGRSDQHVAPFSIPKYCISLQNTRSNYFRHKWRFSRCFSDHANFITGNPSDSTDDVTPPTSLSGELSPGGDTAFESDSSDEFEMFLDTFPTTIKQNVTDVICKVDDLPFSIADPNNETRLSAQSKSSSDDPMESKAKRTHLSPKKSSLRKRWEGILHKEKDRHRRRKRILSNRRQFQRGKPSIKTQWDEAFRRNNYYIKPGLSNQEQNEESALDGLGIESDLSEIDARDQSSDDIPLSPIFRFQVNQQMTDFEAPLSIESKDDNIDAMNHTEVQRVVFNAIDKEEEVDRTDAHTNAIFESISLLIAMTSEDWRKYDSSVHLSEEGDTVGNEMRAEKSDFHDSISAEQEVVNEATTPNQIPTNRNQIRHFLRHVTERKYVLTTPIVNLLLAHLVTSTEIENQELGEACLQIFEEMKMLADSGRYECRPDSTTYRILILAFSRRFQGMGEAVKLSKQLIDYSSIDINPELFNEALRVCRTKTELDAARLLMNSALSNPRISINAASCIIYTEMLKTGKLDEEAINLFNRIKKASLLTPDDEDKYLISLCQWPLRSRRGDVLDLSSFWAEIRNILEQKTLSAKIPDIRVWITYLEGVHGSAKNDDSLWQMAAGATRTVLNAYPKRFVGRKLMTIGLDASSYIEDTKLISFILKRLANEPSISPYPSKLTANDAGTTMRPAKVPFRTLKNALYLCLKTSDADSAKSILESVNQIGDTYPIGAKAELHSLVVKCHAKVNDAQNANIVLRMMIEDGMKPSEELYSEVLRAMAAAGQHEEMEELFKSMEMGNEDGIKPGVLSYDAILLARIKEKSWDEVLSLYEEMKAKGIKPSSYTIKGYIVATNQKGGKESVLSALESLLQCNAQLDESVFRLASETLLKGVDENLDSFRKSIREIGERHENLRVASLDLVRSIRYAEIESSRAKVVHESMYENTKHSGEDAWRVATTNLLVFAKALFLEDIDDKIDFS